jgi:putative membrane protein
MQIKPDKKLITKNWLTLLTTSVLIVIAGILCHILIPLSPKATSAQVGAIVWPIAIAAIVLMWLIGVPVVILWVKNLSYHIEDERVTIHKGILTKIQQNIPYRAVTDFMLHRSLYDRFLGLASIKIQTAGQGQSATGYEGKLSGLTDWDSLHAELRDKIK